MSLSDFYEKLGVPFSGVIFERAVERALVDVLAQFQEMEDEPLYDVTVHPGVRGVPLIFKTYEPDDAGTKGKEFEEAKKAASHIMILASGYDESEGEERCKFRVVVVTQMRDGEPAEQEEKHEKWCAAVRGIMGPSAQGNVVPLCNSLSDEVEVCGWEADEAAQDEFVGGRWVHTQNYDLTGAMLS